MNLQDIIEKNKEQGKILDDLNEFRSEINHAKIIGENLFKQITIKCHNNTLGTVYSDTRMGYTAFREALINIDGYFLKDVIRRIEETYNNNIIKEILHEVEKNYLDIVGVRKIWDEKKAEKYHEAYIKTIKIENELEKVNLIISYSESLNKDLIHNIKDESLKLRFMKEDNSFENLICNLNLVDSIYRNLNKLIGDKEKLQFNRIESGTLLIYLSGAAATLLTFKPLLELSYKVYSENLSKSAKLNNAEKDIKVRGEYIKLIKELNGISEFVNEDFQNALMNLETDIKELYRINPYILVDKEYLGIKELKDKEIDLKLLVNSEVN